MTRATLALIFLWFCAACTDTLPRSNKLQSFRVTLQTANVGTADNPLPFAVTSSTDFVIDIDALDAYGMPLTSFSGPVSVTVVPGQIAQLTPAQPTLSGGSLQGVHVSVSKSFGTTNLWVQDLTGTNPNAVGTSANIYFQNPRIRDIQQPTGSGDASPLTGTVVSVDRGNNYVVNVSSSGFYVVDTSDNAYNSVFAFSFSRPEDLRRGDKLLRFGGDVSEFVHYTEIGFPTWDVDRRCPTANDPGQVCDDGEFCLNGRCFGQQCGEVVCAEGSVCIDGACSPNTNIPDPVTDPDVSNATVMEQYEGGLIKLSNIMTSQEFRACDDPAVNPGANGNGTCEFCRTCNANRDINSVCPEGGRCCPVGTVCYLPKGECATTCSANRDPNDGSCPSGGSCCPVGNTCDLRFKMCDGCTVAEKVESQCEDECAARNQNSPGGICSSECDFRQYGQYRVGITDAQGAWNGKSILVTSSDTVPSFLPNIQQNLGRRFRSMTGTLKNVYAPGPIWILEVRDECDIDGIDHIRQDCSTVR
jgi:hypothetical protein